LICWAQRHEKGVVTLAVEAGIVPKDSVLARVEKGKNILTVQGDAVGVLVCEGMGAGPGPTASAVVADMVDGGRGGRKDAIFGIAHQELLEGVFISPQEIPGDFFVIQEKQKPLVISNQRLSDISQNGKIFRLFRDL